MDGDREGTLDRIVGEALQRSQTERQAYLESACESSRDLRAEAERILADLETLGSFLEPGYERADLDLAGSGILLPGEKFAGYRIESLHARGGSSEVYVAKKLDAGEQLVALKIWRFAEHRPPEDLSVVEHPNLVRVLEFGREPERGLSFLSMALVPGPSMAALLEDSIESERSLGPRLRRILVQRFLEMAEALAALHRADLRHGDVKPANMVFDCQGQEDPLEHSLVLVDLGLVRANSTQTSLATIYATFAYAAPEVLLGLRQDARSDVFSLGVSMHDLLCQRFPWQRERRQTQGLELLTEKLPDCDSDLAAIVAEATALDPGHRYQSAEVMAADMRAWLQGAEVSARPRSLLARQKRRLARSHRRRLVLAGLSLLALIGLLLIGSGVLWISDSVSRLSLLSRSLNDGDLATYARERAAVSPLLSNLIARPAVDRIQAFDSVMDRIQQGDLDGARIHAARLLGRDGLDAYPELMLWYGHSLDHGADEEVDETTRVLSRLFLDHPVKAAVEMPSMDALTESLQSLLDTSRSRSTRLHAVSSLGGCALASSIPALLTHLEDSLVDSEESIETFRVSMVALQRITQRSGDLAAELLTALDWHALVDRALAILETVLPHSFERVTVLTAPLDLWLAITSIKLQEQGQAEPVASIMHKLPPTMERTRAVNRDPDLLAELRGGYYVQVTELLKDRAFAGGWAYHHLGSLLGHYPSASQSEFLQYLETKPGGRHLEIAELRTLYESGIAEANELRAGDSQVWQTYPVSHLGNWLQVSKTPYELLPEKTVLEYPRSETPVSGEELISFWDFSVGELEAYGLSRGVESRVASLTPDVYLAGHSFLLFSVPDVSALRLRFQGNPRVTQLLRLRIKLQKGLRQVLPYSGSCGLNIILNGELRTVLPNLVEGSRQEIVLPIGRVTDSQEQVLELQLSGDSNTSLRILSVGIF